MDGLALFLCPPQILDKIASTTQSIVKDRGVDRHRVPKPPGNSSHFTIIDLTKWNQSHRRHAMSWSASTAGLELGSSVENRALHLCSTHHWNSGSGAQFIWAVYLLSWQEAMAIVGETNDGLRKQRRRRLGPQHQRVRQHRRVSQLWEMQYTAVMLENIEIKQIKPMQHQLSCQMVPLPKRVMSGQML